MTSLQYIDLQTETPCYDVSTTFNSMKRTCQLKRDIQEHDYKACEFHTTLN